MHLLTFYQQYVSTGWERAGLHNSSYRTQNLVYQHISTIYQQLVPRVITGLSTVYQLLTGVEISLVNYQQSRVKMHVNYRIPQNPTKRHAGI